MKYSKNIDKENMAALTIKGEVWKQSSIAPAYYVSNYGRIYGTLYHKLIQPETSHGYARIFIKDLATNQFRHYFVHILVATEMTPDVLMLLHAIEEAENVHSFFL